mmetsp:Transcript_6223/g.15782  ORF Transcript_6223/g.15782 Transcript_6223/m.15782 type:complete len:257 (-) Transcript_6223:703-1473(-)
MWDFDANWIAVAAGIPTDNEQAQRVVSATSSQLGLCGRHMPSWVSAQRYDREHTYQDTRGVRHTGDGAIAMARIAWMEGQARRAVGDVLGFERSLLGPLQRTVLREVFLPERYGCHGFPAKHRFFPEYPEVVGILLREVRYGLRIEPFDVQLRPFSVRRFRYRAGALQVHFEPELVRLTVPGSTPRWVRLHIGSLQPRERYSIRFRPTVESGCAGPQASHSYAAGELPEVVTADALGEVYCNGTVGQHCELILELL